MVIYQGGRLREVTNFQLSDMKADEVAFVKMHLKAYDTPVALCELPPTEDWNFQQISSVGNGLPPSAAFDGNRLLDQTQLREPPEMPNKEEIPEVPSIRVEELIEEEPSEVAGPRGGDKQGVLVSMKLNKYHPHPHQFPRARLAFSDVSEAAATYVFDQTDREGGATEAPNDELVDLTDTSDDVFDDDEFACGHL
eukprot:3165084-Pyramimonas_sp.AAC.1